MELDFVELDFVAISWRCEGCITSTERALERKRGDSDMGGERGEMCVRRRICMCVLEYGSYLYHYCCLSLLCYMYKIFVWSGVRSSS